MSKHFEIIKFGTYMVDLPTQFVTVPGDGKLSEISGAEISGNHPAVILAVAEDGRSAVVCPMSIALNANGGERYRNPKKEWLRIQHNNHPSYVLTEQIRMVDRARFIKMESSLGEYDRQQLELRLKFLFGLV
jgi:mRNA-degrading endonuclease toxin of MazEF toxin-antitoxin module